MNEKYSDRNEIFPNCSKEILKKENHVENLIDECRIEVFGSDEVYWQFLPNELNF